ncbi:bifunctional metallophosphatase/5'-nucleotidase [Salinirubrum litoreum]|uniref:Bifunctional metallophosphatase/5'-nucleotidase n=1 Tax=Salinirubrum litoreum TaxID=1126234 RepID=A0ABD5RCS2_9EURY|nr:5'-nucleotidase C-terminal domain-containing protein [Salinirubrum litoreum]
MRRTLVHLILIGCLVTAGFAPVAGTAIATDASTTHQTPTATDVSPAPVAADTTTNTTNASTADASATETQTVTLLTYNDVQTAAAEDGSFPRMVTAIEERRAATDNPTVVAGAGDQIGPHALSPISAYRAPVDVLNTVQPDADVIGNHEFDYGLQEIDNVTRDSEFPWLASNLVNSTTGEPFSGTENYTVVERDGVKVGFIGLVDRGATYGKTNIDFAAEGITLEDYTQDGPETARYLKQQKDVDVVVALAHTGVPDAKELARADEGAIDVIAVGDDEQFYPPQETSGTVITEAEARADYLGELNLTVENGDVTAWNGRLIDTSTYAKNETASRIITDYRSEVSLDSTVTVSETKLDARFATNYHRESNYGNLITDAMRAEADADVAITNAGGIRSNSQYGPGPITGGDVFNTLPFPNTLVTVELTGAELKETLASQVVTLESDTGQQFGEEISQQTSGVRFEWVPHENASPQIRDVYVNRAGPDEPADWEKLDEDATYEVAVNNFMAAGGSGYPLADEPRVEESDKLIATVVVDYLEARDTVNPQVEGRMERVDSDASDAEVRADGNGKVVLTLDAPSDVESVEADSFTLTAKAAGVGSVQAEKVVFDAEDDRLVVRFDDAQLANYVNGDDAELDLYGEYESSQYEFVYFEHARLNADITVESAEKGTQKGNAGNGKQNAVAAPTATATAVVA